ncbi:MAG: GNAT family N-acetyltransferase [Filomicrobium sp.]
MGRLLDEPNAFPLPAPELRATQPDSHSHLFFEVVDSVERFGELKEQWDALLEEHGKAHHVFYQHSWLMYWNEVFLAAERQSLAVLIGWRKGRLRFAMPLVHEQRLGCRIARFMGVPVNQYSDVLISRDENISEVLPVALDILTRELKCDLLLAPQVRSDACLKPGLEDGRARPVSTDAAPVIGLVDCKGPEDLAARLSASARKSRKRRRKRLNSKGAVGLVAASDGPQGRELVDLGLKFKADWFTKHSIVSSAFTDPRFATFWHDVVSGRHGPCGLHVTALTLEERPIAVEFGLRFKQAHFAHVGAFDLTMEDCSPGQAHLDMVVQDCIDHGLEEYDLLPPVSSYKERLANQTLPVCDYVLPLSRLGAAVDGTRLTEAPRMAKAMISSLPSGARSVLSSSVQKFRGYFTT